jgi:hypothetical protein
MLSLEDKNTRTIHRDTFIYIPEKTKKCVSKNQKNMSSTGIEPVGTDRHQPARQTDRQTNKVGIVTISDEASLFSSDVESKGCVWPLPQEGTGDDRYASYFTFNLFTSFEKEHVSQLCPNSY